MKLEHINKKNTAHERSCAKKFFIKAKELVDKMLQQAKKTASVAIITSALFFNTCGDEKFNENDWKPIWYQDVCLSDGTTIETKQGDNQELSQDRKFVRDVCDNDKYESIFLSPLIFTIGDKSSTDMVKIGKKTYYADDKYVILGSVCSYSIYGSKNHNPYTSDYLEIVIGRWPREINERGVDPFDYKTVAYVFGCNFGGKNCEREEKIPKFVTYTCEMPLARFKVLTPEQYQEEAKKYQ